MNSSSPSPTKGGVIDSPFDSPTFKLDMSIKVDAPVGAMSISPSSRDVVLASRQGLHIVDLDNPYDPPRFLQHLTAWSVADVQWSPHASHSHWVVSTNNHRAIVWNLAMPSHKAIEHVLASHTRAITDINFSAHEPNVLATCSVDSFVHCWDLRAPRRPAISFCDWRAGATQVKYNRQNPYILASAHDRNVYIWDTRMGAREIRKIVAHSTKIYGLDWNRTRPTGIVTCALDKSVRFWDYEYAPHDTPERIIHTPFPVWRARHTPFGWGVLTMPQRGDTSLYLWDRRAKGTNQDEPVKRFEGHTDNVKEFLWRWRGGERDDGGDSREFQLVTWSLDKDIRLWDVSQDVMAKIGHDPNKKMRFRVTRKGAKYITFRDTDAVVKEFAENLKEKEDGLFIGQSKGGLSHGIGQQLNGNPPNDDGDRRFERALTGAREGGFMRVGRRRPLEINPITWMKGVKITRKVPEGDGNMDGSRSSARGDFGMSWDTPENLGDEVSLVGSKLKNLNFEKVNIATRTCTVSLTGPWGHDGKRIFVRADISFPAEYPSNGCSIPEFKLERTNNLSDENIDTIDFQLRRIATAYVARRRVCLEPCLRHLMGELADESEFAGSDDDQVSSSDDEEIVNTSILGDEEEGLSSLLNSAKQESVPLPKACGAIWAPDGRLVCFFPLKEERTAGKGLLSSLAARENERSMRIPGGGRLWEGFGRLYMSNSARGRADDGDHDSSDTSNSSYSSDDTSDGDTDLHHTGQLRSSFGWRLQANSTLTRIRRGGSTDRSTQRSTGTGVRTAATITPEKKKSVASIHDFSYLLPAKKELASFYHIGEGAEVCKHNAEVAERFGLRDLADVWRLVEMVLCDDVPLEIYNSPKNHGEMVMVMARRACLESGRRDSGLGMEFDDDEDTMMAMPESEFWGKVKWGSHPMGGRWLIEQLFEYFERKADIQMLAMLSCVLCETDNRIGHTEPSPVNVSRDYYASIEMMLQSQQQSVAFSVSPSHHSANLTPMGTAGSYSSSVGSRMHFGSDPLIPYSTGTTPPTAGFRLGTEDWSGPISLSASPEQSHNHMFRRNRAFGPGNASPPSRRQPRPSPAESVLGPFANSAVTWGVTTTFGSGSKAASDTVTDSDSGDPMDPITITMFNGPLIDDAPLLSPKRRTFYRAYREAYADLLFAWGHTISRLEMLKFSALEPPPASPILLPVRKAAPMGLEIAGFCSKCGGVLDVTSGARGECKVCKRRQVTMNCVVCEVIIKGLYGACLKCGHVAHATCWRGWFDGVGTNSLDRGCPTGCGCVCLFEEEGDLLGPEVILEPPVVGTPGVERDWDAFEGEDLW
ncbi:hypothetical protein BZA05DRAFT_377720 [Tricharina praecox]|uniref:uncharacterized protein n=1 Tax=Tricharina praecox TaxID=43433 RepID=UPI0022210BB4|nr:uncharacterized protein BZA05DRAFT_377720 [Tricharina praecox]KAI5846190.1 hypothetical protein BZA05DRAFT_377720 [Tricharina praecox]